MQKIKIEALNIKADKKTWGIKTTLNGQEVWINCWNNPRAKTLNVGETILVSIYTEEHEGKTYTKFRLPSLDHLLAQLINSPAPPAKPVTEAPAPLQPVVEGDPNYVDPESIPF